MDAHLPKFYYWPGHLMCDCGYNLWWTCATSCVKYGYDFWSPCPTPCANMDITFHGQVSVSPSKCKLRLEPYINIFSATTVVSTMIKTSFHNSYSYIRQSVCTSATIVTWVVFVFANISLFSVKVAHWGNWSLCNLFLWSFKLHGILF